MINKIFLLLFLLATKISWPQKNADLIVFNGTIGTMVKEGEFAQAVAVKDGIILATGTTVKILEDCKNVKTILTDAKGKTVIPSLNDSHIYLKGKGLKHNCDLCWDSIKTLEETTIKKVHQIH